MAKTPKYAGVTQNEDGSWSYRLKMKLPEDSPLREELERHGLPATGAQAIFLALFRKAAAGDVSAAKLIREAAGEKVSEPEVVSAAESELAGLSDEALRAIAGG